MPTAFEISIFVAAFCLLVGLRFIPAEYCQFSKRNRRAIRLAVAALTEIPDVTANRAASRIYKTEADRTVVMVLHVGRLQPGIWSFFAVLHSDETVLHLGTGQVHWGIRPEDIWRHHAEAQT